MLTFKNILKFKGLSPDDTAFILNNFTKPSIFGSSLIPLNLEFDFNKIISEPETLAECPAEYIFDKSHKDKDGVDKSVKPWFNYYSWRRKYWGAKWNAANNRIIIDNDNITFVFTSDDIPYPVYQAISQRYPDLKFDVKYDNDTHTNAGHLTSIGGQLISVDIPDINTHISEVWNY